MPSSEDDINAIDKWLGQKGVGIWGDWMISEPERRKLAASWFFREIMDFYEWRFTEEQRKIVRSQNGNIDVSANPSGGRFDGRDKGNQMGQVLAFGDVSMRSVRSVQKRAGSKSTARGKRTRGTGQ